MLSFDPIRYKVDQCREWSVSAAGWLRHWDLWEKGASHINERLVEMAEIGPGQRVLDVATGLGEPAFTAARRVGPAGWVVATDLSLDMLSLARTEASRQGIAHIEFRVMDAEQLEMPAGSFQAVLCRWALMFLPDLPRALRGMRRLLAPGGRLAAAVRGPPDKVPMASLPMGIVRSIRRLPPPPPGTPGTFSLSDVDLLTRSLEQARFEDVAINSLTVTLRYRSAEHFIEEREATSASLRLLLEQASKSELASIRSTLAEAVERYRQADGVIRIPNETICVTGRA